MMSTIARNQGEQESSAAALANTEPGAWCWSLL
jgi:hypothetical protein